MPTCLKNMKQSKNNRMKSIFNDVTDDIFKYLSDIFRKF